MTEEPLTLERAADLARRGFQPIEIEVYGRTKADDPNSYKHLRTLSPREVCKAIRDVLGEYPEGGEEGLHPFPYYSCGNCPNDAKDGMARCGKYSGLYNSPFGHGPDGNGPCDMHKQCKGYKDWADCPWPTRDGRLAVFSVRGSSEGDYVHVEQGGKLILLSKTFQGRDAAWTFARNVADLLGV